MELVYVEQGLIESTPASSCSIPAMAMDGLTYKLLFVVLCHK